MGSAAFWMSNLHIYNKLDFLMFERAKVTNTKIRKYIFWWGWKWMLPFYASSHRVTFTWWFLQIVADTTWTCSVHEEPQLVSPLNSGWCAQCPLHLHDSSGRWKKSPHVAPISCSITRTCFHWESSFICSFWSSVVTRWLWQKLNQGESWMTFTGDKYKCAPTSVDSFASLYSLRYPLSGLL